MSLVCGEPTCRRVIRPDDFDTYYRDWDEKIKASIPKLFQVQQPLMPFLDGETRESLDQFFAQPELYRSVYSLRLQQSTAER